MICKKTFTGIGQSFLDFAGFQQLPLLEPTPPNGGLMYPAVVPAKNRILTDPSEVVYGVAVGSLAASCPWPAWHACRWFLRRRSLI